MPLAQEPSDLSVRRLAASDWRSLKELRLRALGTDPTAFGSTLVREQAFPDDLWQTRARRAAESPDSATFVAALAASDWVGMATVDHANGRRTIFGMWVDPSVRRRGIAQALLNACRSWPGSAGPSAPLYLEVNPTQVAAVALYRAAGFEFTERYRPLDHDPGSIVREMVCRPGAQERSRPGRP